MHYPKKARTREAWPYIGSRSGPAVGAAAPVEPEKFPDTGALAGGCRPGIRKERYQPDASATKAV
jgi:hypothetical protein